MSIDRGHGIATSSVIADSYDLDALIADTREAADLAEEAKEDALQAIQAAEAAIGDAEQAVSDAVDAKNDSVAAQGFSETAQGFSEDARGDSELYASELEDTTITLSDGTSGGYSSLHYNAKAQQAKTDSVDAQGSSETAQGLSEGARDSSINAKNDAEKLATNPEDSQFQLTDNTTGYSALHYTAKTQALKDAFDLVYLGSSATVPSTSVDGALYFDTSTDTLKVWDGSAWLTSKPSASDQTNIDTVKGEITPTNNIATVAGKETEIGLLGTTDAVGDMSILGATGVVDKINTVAGSIGDINNLAPKVTEIGRLGTTDAVGDMAILGATGVVDKIDTVAGKETEIGRLGTAEAVADMAILATPDIVADMNTLATPDIVSDMNTLGTADVVNDMNILATPDIVADMNTLATSDTVDDMAILATTAIVEDMALLATTENVGNMNLLGTTEVVGNLDTVADNLDSVNNFGDTYSVGTSAERPATSASTEGQLYFNTSDDVLQVFDGGAWVDAAISAGDFVTKTSSTGAAQMPVGDNSQQPSGSAGMFRYNSDTNDFEGYTTEWGAIAGSGGGGDNDFDGGDSATLYGSADIDIESGASV